MICIKCKKEIPDNANYCNFCGVSQKPKKKKNKRANGTGTAYKKNGKWYARWIVGWYFDKKGKAQPKRETKGGFETKTDALKYAQNHAVKSTGLYQKPKTVGDIWGQIEEDLMKSLSKDKQTQYQCAYRRLEKITKIPIADLKFSEIQRVIDESELTYYPARDIKTIMSHIYKAAIRQNLVNENLSFNIELPPKKEKDARAFTVDEVKQLWKTYEEGNRFAGLILLMIYTGLMPVEVMKLTSSMINLEKGIIVGCGAKTEERKSKEIVLADDIIPVVTDLIDPAESTDETIFCHSKQKFYDLYHETLKKANIEYIPPYSARHTTANALLASGKNIAEIKSAMRHKTVETTRRYFTDDIVDRKEVMNSIDFKDNHYTENN